MHQHYVDILDRIPEPPTWFDDYGVPRFVEFSPEHLSNIHAREAALAEVSCQGCGRLFRVALTGAYTSKRFSLSDEIRLGWVRYGDPPNVRCCAAGPSMSSIMCEVLQYWSRDLEVSMHWERIPTFEGPVGARLDPPDSVSEVLDAIASGAKAIRVMCTSQTSRYDLAGRILARMTIGGRILVTYPLNYGLVARKMLDGLVPEAELGHCKDDRHITLADFDHLENVSLASIRMIAVLAAPRPRSGIKLTEVGAARLAATQRNWNEAATLLNEETREKVCIELALAHSNCMIRNIDVVVDAGRTLESTDDSDR